jgi:HEAT repeat protein
MMFSAESDALKKAAWPRCDQLAMNLAKHGEKALPALEAALSSRIHHVRSACLRAINSVKPEAATTIAPKFLNDRAYEVRETAASILGVPIPDKS